MLLLCMFVTQLRLVPRFRNMVSKIKGSTQCRGAPPRYDGGRLKRAPLAVPSGPERFRAVPVTYLAYIATTGHNPLVLHRRSQQQLSRRLICHHIHPYRQ